ncbi:MFS transporter [Achromobacter aloeverae]|uniref:MFS transporter n=1 Tax=Achromobacter aloeverae TaxID=1750518 RepID=A0A4Q1HLC4_9BURK|nr:MFS transporter [Achromobacter aloeverae]RXN91237.1 MFS transporter [Achromobacter aloeverae]
MPSNTPSGAAAAASCPRLSLSTASSPNWAGLFALMLASFATTANETVPAGLLPQLAAGLGVSEAWAGQLVTLCALGAGLGAVPLATGLRHWPRRRVLVLALGGFFLCNAITALSTHFLLTLAARLVVGAAAGLAWSVIAPYARRLAPPAQQGRALAVAMLGLPLALALGVPLAAWLGQLVGWRWVFGGLSGLALLLAVWLLAAVPDAVDTVDAGRQSRPASASQAPRPRLGQVLALPGVRPVLAVVLLWVLAHYTLYTYIAPFLAAAGQADRLGAVLSTFGLCTLAGLWLVGWLVDRHLRGLVLASLGLFAGIAAAYGAWGTSWPVIAAGAALWGLSFSGAPTLLQTALGDAAGEHESVAQSMLVTVFNLAFAGSGVLGGALLATVGATALPWMPVALAAAAWGTAFLARRHGFRGGRR